MQAKNPKFYSVFFCLTIFLLLFQSYEFAQEEVVDFESDRWVLRNAEIVEFMGRKCLVGYAFLKGVEFENGVIEVDIAVPSTDVRSYPGIIFRMQSEDNYERFYIRPHRAPLYPDALQYMPVINGTECWQLYNGPGYTSGANIPANQWLHLKMEISGRQARIYLGSGSQPEVVINDLKHGVSRGTLGVFGPRDRTSYFSNFKYRIDNNLEFSPPPRVDIRPGLITEWQLSQPFKASKIDRERSIEGQALSEIKWQKVSSEPSGLINVARYVRRIGREPDCVLARATIHSDKDEVKKFLFGYSDEVSLFLNGQLYFRGNSAYRYRDPSFLGIIGLFDAVYLPLKRGENELLLMVTEAFGGWGFMCQDGTAVFQDDSLEKLWISANQLQIPESAAYDPLQGCIYVSNYDGYNPSGKEGLQSISKVSLDGKIISLNWVAGLYNPTGLALFKDRLFVVERRNLVEINTTSGQIVNRYSVPQPGFLNDVAIDQSGQVYISDSAKHVIYRFAEGLIEEWIKGTEIRNPNGLHIHRNKLIVGNNSDYSLKSVDLETKEIRTIVTLIPGIIDGIKTDNDGNFIVSHNQGRLYSITPSGQVTKLLDTTVPEINLADFEYAAEKRLIIIPTFVDNRVIAFKLNR